MHYEHLAEALSNSFPNLMQRWKLKKQNCTLYICTLQNLESMICLTFLTPNYTVRRFICCLHSLHTLVHSVWISYSIFLLVILLEVLFNVWCRLGLCSISTAGVWRELYMLLNQTTSTRRVNAQEPLDPLKN